MSECNVIFQEARGIKGDLQINDGETFFDHFEVNNPFFQSLIKETKEIFFSKREDENVWVIDFNKDEMRCLFYIKIPICDKKIFMRFLKPLYDYFSLIKKENKDD